eukprot:jgi/Tetstr1/442416/TSEL_030540.t1
MTLAPVVSVLSPSVEAGFAAAGAAAHGIGVLGGVGKEALSGGGVDFGQAKAAYGQVKGGMHSVKAACQSGSNRSGLERRGKRLGASQKIKFSAFFKMPLSDSLVFKPKPASIAGTTRRHTVPAYNGVTFKGQCTILINIPCGRRGHYLNTRMSYLRFSVKNKHANNTFAPDYTASSFIRSLSLYHGSNLLEQIHEYNALFHLFMDLQGSVEDLMGAGNILY